MRRLSFIIVMGLTLLYSLATVAQSLMFVRYTHLVARFTARQNELAMGQRTNEFARQLARRMSLVAQHDPAMEQLLQKHGVRVVVKAPDQDANAAVPPPTGSGPNP
jgi:hypothetical protein